MKFNFDNINVKKHIFEAKFGLEKESLRINKNGFLAHTPHPFIQSKNIDRDFCENQTEFITDVFDSVNGVCNNLRKLHAESYNTLLNLESGKEYFWAFSNPPYVKSYDDILIAEFKGELESKSIYREYLAKKYGKMKMLYSGIHFNFNFSDELINACFEESTDKSLDEYKGKLYLDLTAKVTQFSWLIVYLMSASPVMDGSFFKSTALGQDVFSGYSSARCSEIGYWNDFVPILDYSGISEYINSIQKYIDSGKLKSVSELYYPVRIKPRDAQSTEILKDNEVSHIELRMLDLNPLSPIGILEEDMKFLHLLLIYLMSFEGRPFTEEEQLNAIGNSKNAAKYDDINTLILIEGKRLPLKNAAEAVLNNIEKFYSNITTNDIHNTIEYQKQKIQNQNNRYANIILKRYGKDYVKKGIKLSEAYSEELLGK